MSEPTFNSWHNFLYYVEEKTGVVYGHLDAFFVWRENRRTYVDDRLPETPMKLWRLKIPIEEFAPIIQAWDARTRLGN
ncbi:hypothetical protein LCGC14_1078320 [marine sediment metagenome]|uniref:Uncharacterized protein n=1 Tax=marine sediment metagenome TaxID=412755 RepID=A0A0F9PZA6_9ZZZZ